MVEIVEDVTVLIILTRVLSQISLVTRNCLDYVNVWDHGRIAGPLENVVWLRLPHQVGRANLCTK